MRLRFLIGIIISFIIIGIAGFVQAEVIANFVDKINPFEKLELAGYLKNETAFGFQRDNNDGLQKFKNVFDLKGNYKLNDSVEFYTDINYWYDAVYDIDDRYDSIPKKDRSVLVTPEDKYILKELYMDVLTDSVDLRLGKQYVVWGTTDGVRILDLVNPLDLREWTLKEFSDLRIPLWMLKAEGSITKNGGLQLLVIPDYEPNYYSPAGAPFALRSTIIGAEGAASPFVNVRTIDNKPERTLEDSKVGLRWRDVIETGMFSGLEYTLNYLHTYDSAAAYYVSTAPGFPVPIKLTRNAEQIEVWGGSFAKTITKGLAGDFGKGWTLRGEFAYITNGAMNYGTDRNIVSTVDVDQYNYAFGFDKTFLTNWQFSTQFIQMIARATEDFDHSKYTLLFGPTRGPLDKIENMLSLKVSTDFIHERLKPEVLVLYGDDNDWRLAPKISFEVNDNLIVAGGLNIFYGKEQQMNGQFDDQDQIFIETKYSW